MKTHKNNLESKRNENKNPQVPLKTETPPKKEDREGFPPQPDYENFLKNKEVEKEVDEEAGKVRGN